MNPANLFANIPNDIPEEIFEDLVKTDKVRIERIISHGQASAKDDWYDQDQNEWVMVVQGQARLQFDSTQNPEQAFVELKPGDHIDIPAHIRHRVDWTSTDEPTIWIAVFY